MRRKRLSSDRIQHYQTFFLYIYCSKSLRHCSFRRRIEFPRSELDKSEEIKEFECVSNLE